MVVCVYPLRTNQSFIYGAKHPKQAHTLRQGVNTRNISEASAATLLNSQTQNWRMIYALGLQQQMCDKRAVVNETNQCSCLRLIFPFSLQGASDLEVMSGV